MKPADLSRAISHALRHEPWLYEMELDQEGWVPVDTLIAALRASRAEWQDLAEADIRAMMASADKQRFALAGGKIRALYGHSTPARLKRTRATPPEYLYHGTSTQAAGVILTDALRPMGRQYVHLSTDPETATLVGRRKAKRPVLLRICAAEADRNDIAFYFGNERVWLADCVPKEFMELYRPET